MMADDLLVQWRKFYDAPDADNQAVMAETQDRFVRAILGVAKGFCRRFGEPLAGP